MITPKEQRLYFSGRFLNAGIDFLAHVLVGCMLLWCSSAHADEMLYQTTRDHEDYKSVITVFEISEPPQLVMEAYTNLKGFKYAASHDAKDLYVAGAFASEIDALKEALHFVRSQGYDTRKITRFNTGMTDAEIRDQVARYAAQNEEWKRYIRLFHKVQLERRMHDVFAEVVLQSGAYAPLEVLLKEYGLRIKKIGGIEKFMTWRYYLPDKNGKPTKRFIQTPGRTYYAFFLEPIPEER